MILFCSNFVKAEVLIAGPERRRLKLIAQALQPQELGITVRTEAVGHAQEELEKDLNRLMETWKEIMEKAAAAALAVNKGEEAAVPVLLHREMGQTLTIIRDFFTEKVSRLVVDSSQSYQEVISYLQEVAPHLISRVVLYSGKVPIFDMFNVEEGLERLSNERVKLPNGGYLVMQETEALVSIDVNGGMGMLGHSTKQRKAILEVNLAAARQIASEIRLRDIGGIIVVDFIDMDNAIDEKLVHEEMRKAIQRDRSKVTISEISEFGLMEMTRKRVRPSVTWTINDSCPTCKGTGRVEALETTLSKIERAIRRFLAVCPERERVNFGANKWPQVLLCIEPTMLDYLKSWKKKRIIQLSNSLKVWISLKVGMDLSPGQFKVLEVIKTSSEKDIVGPPSGSQSNSQQQQQQLSSVSSLDKQGSARPHLF
jgi:Rne/Rng family ribonuclease